MKLLQKLATKRHRPKKQAKSEKDGEEQNDLEEDSEGDDLLDGGDRDEDELGKNTDDKKFDPRREELKIKKLENRLNVLKSLNGKSFRLWAITIARFDLGIEFSNEDYCRFAEEVHFIFGSANSASGKSRLLNSTTSLKSSEVDLQGLAKDGM